MKAFLRRLVPPLLRRYRGGHARPSCLPIWPQMRPLSTTEMACRVIRDYQPVDLHGPVICSWTDLAMLANQQNHAAHLLIQSLEYELGRKYGT